MFRLQAVSEDDTMYLRLKSISSGYIENRSCWCRGGFSLYLKKTKYQRIDF